jgi:predicted DsbA family dithiol-disulfide isomerase
MQMRVGATQLSLAVEMDTKIDQITKMMERLAAGAHTDPAEMDPNVLAEIAKQAGMEAGKILSRAHTHAHTHTYTHTHTHTNTHTRTHTHTCIHLFLESCLT